MKHAAAWTLSVALLAAPARAAPEAPAEKEEDAPISADLIEKLPESVQEAVTMTSAEMAAARNPPDRFRFTLLGLPRSQLGSGTSWQPSNSPLYVVIPHVGEWGILVHGTLFAGYNWYTSERGWHRFMGRNTLMGTVFRRFGRGELLARMALSLEPLTIGRRGYPLILQTGQTRDGTRLHDRQYALDFFRELAASYSFEITPSWALFFYAALSGEPALGPVYFTQRASASADPTAPLGLQWQEISHASYGVFTFGAFTQTLKLEASWFNGEVPKERPYTIALRRPDSFSFRATWNPSAAWSMQLSYGFLKRPVEQEPGRSVHRVSTSVSYVRGFRGEAGLTATLSLAERVTKGGERGAAALAETYWDLDGHHTLYGRSEIVQKSGAELVLSEPSSTIYAVGTLAAGYVYYFGPFASFAPGLGVRGSLNPMAAGLERDYGTRLAYGLLVYAHLRTAALPFGR